MTNCKENIMSRKKFFQETESEENSFLIKKGKNGVIVITPIQITWY